MMVFLVPPFPYLGFCWLKHSLRSSSMGAFLLRYSRILVVLSCIMVWTLTSLLPLSFLFMYSLRVLDLGRLGVRYVHCEELSCPDNSSFNHL